MFDLSTIERTLIPVSRRAEGTRLPLSQEKGC